jgi:hypothetical protein
MSLSGQMIEFKVKNKDKRSSQESSFIIEPFLTQHKSIPTDFANLTLSIFYFISLYILKVFGRELFEKLLLGIYNTSLKNRILMMVKLSFLEQIFGKFG